VQQGLAAVVGVIIARELGRTSETDGFFAAYGVFLVLAIAATAARIVLLPPLARARDERRLVGETVGFAMALMWIAVPLLAVAIVAADGIASVLTGFDEGAARDTAAESLPWLVAAALAQLFAGLGGGGGTGWEK
jgi:O-antigen/teichoic acid export membrane protein